MTMNDEPAPMTLPETIYEAAALLRSVRYDHPATAAEDRETRDAWVSVAREFAYRLSWLGVRLDQLPEFVPTTGVGAAIAGLSAAATMEFGLTGAIQHRPASHAAEENAT